MWILSGRYGLIEPATPIPWYDMLLLDRDVAGLVDACAQMLAESGIRRLIYHTASIELASDVAPYLRLVRRSCLAADVPLEVVTLPGVPV